eukprot:jgi/Ulvmu1/2444/UM135_0004.1
MGFISGFFQNADPAATMLPPWLSGITCAGPEADLSMCRRSSFGETSTCGFFQLLFCISNRQSNGDARLAAGSADAGGAWEYGRLEVQFNGVWSIVNDRFNDFGRRGAQVACRSLGYAAGAQLLVGDASPFPVLSTAPDLFREITCNGSETSLADCFIDERDYDYRFDYDGVVEDSVALICSSPSGCVVPAAEPTDGDVRLVPLNGTAVATGACDEVHFGGVELFLQGRWGRICPGRFGGDPEEFTLDAQVICKQLGFPFGTVMDEEEVSAAYDYDYSERDRSTVLTWATEVMCTGKEERLLDCMFPENFGIDYSRDYSYDYFYNENWPAPAHAAPAPAPISMESAPAPSNGLPGAGCDRGDTERLAVICRRFEITDALCKSLNQRVA